MNEKLYNEFRTNNLRADWPKLRTYLFNFIQNPIQAIKYVPVFHWGTIVIFDTLVSLFTGVLFSIVSMSVLNLLFVPIFWVAASLIQISIVSGCFYYVSFFVFQRKAHYKPMFTLFMFAALPWKILNVLSPMLSPVNLIGAGASVLLLTVGLIDHFMWPRKGTLRLLGGLLIIYVIFWIIGQIQVSL